MGKKKKVVEEKKKSCHRGSILVVDAPENMTQDLKDFVDDIKQITRTCPFCGQKPHKDVIEFGALKENIDKIKEEDEYKTNRDYRKIMDEYIKANVWHAEYRISCINEDCLGATTRFCDTADKAEEKWNSRL